MNGENAKTTLVPIQFNQKKLTEKQDNQKKKASNW